MGGGWPAQAPSDSISRSCRRKRPRGRSAATPSTARSPRAGWRRSTSGACSGPSGFSRTVAIKRLHPQFAKDPEFVSMFLDEARLAARIRHPNVVPTLDVVATDGELFLVMEYVQGESLARLLRAVDAPRRRRPDRAIVADDRRAACSTACTPRTRRRDEQGEPLGIVHRDVSPAERPRRRRRRAARARLRRREGGRPRADDARGAAQGQARVHGARAAPRARP